MKGRLNYIQAGYMTAKCLRGCAILLFMTFVCQMVAQKPGYMGRRFLVKAKVINGMQKPLSEFNIEYVVKRRLSIELGFELFDYSRGSKGVKRRTGTVNPVNTGSEFKEYRTLKNGTTTGWAVGISARSYFNAITPAPYGWFMSYSVGYSQLSFSGFDVGFDYRKKTLSTSFDSMTIPPDITGVSGNASVIRLEAPGIGYQRIYFRRLAVEAKVYVMWQYAIMPEHLLNAFEHNYYVRTNTVGFAQDNYSAGLGVDVKIGFLLF
jgi:hypothetical protein